MSSIPPQFPLSVRAWPTKDDKGSALPTLISRINAERGEFRHLTEADLEDEIAKAEIEPAAAHEHGETEDEEEEEEEEAEPDRIKEVMDARNEMLAQIE
jgi:mediator of RNA polymerase II transcription subunit 17